MLDWIRTLHEDLVRQFGPAVTARLEFVTVLYVAYVLLRLIRVSVG